MENTLKILENCTICPHNCKIDRTAGKISRCKAKDTVKIALYSVHNFEEPCISGENGSGTVFFSNCNLNCIYCQNYEISQLGRGKEISIRELADIFCMQQEKNVENINLVTPTSYVPQIIEDCISVITITVFRCAHNQRNNADHVMVLLAAGTVKHGNCTSDICCNKDSFRKGSQIFTEKTAVIR